MHFKKELLLLIALVLITRMPFIFDGFGVEEDSWGLVVNAQEMHDTGEYRASRFPGHPLQEYAYLLIWNQPAWVWNFLSVVVSLAAICFFHLALRRMQINNALQVSLLFCFTPVFVLAGTYTIDYAWTLAFLTASFWLLCERRLWWSGVVLGLAIGCRITTGIFLFPWFILLLNRMDIGMSVRLWMRIAIPTIVIGLLWYIPAYTSYGSHFFDYSDQFPYPPLPKVIFKATLGVFSILGLFALILSAFWGLKNYRNGQLNANALLNEKRLLLVCLIIFILHIIAYLRLPQKAGYMLPAVPWIVLAVGIVLTKKQIRIVAGLFICSPFFFGFNLTDSMRGASASFAAIKFNTAGQEIFMDPLTGPLWAERTKRLNKINYCERVLAVTDTIKQPTQIISGWWYNQLITTIRERPTSGLVQFRFYEKCIYLDTISLAGVQIYYLSEQNLYNDQMFQQECTDKRAQPFPVQ